MTKVYFLLILVMLIPMSAAFADSNDDSCWFILCWFVSNDKSTPEEIYVKAAQNGRDRGISLIKNEISELRENSKIISDGQELGIISGANKIIDATNERVDFLQKLIDEDQYVRDNPNEFLSKHDLVNRAMNYYKIQPDGTPCDDDRRWVDDRNACIREDRANKIFGSWDLEWLRDHPEFD